MIKTEHSGKTFQYVPRNQYVKVMGKWTSIRIASKEAGVIIRDEAGREVFKKNSDFDHILPLPYDK